MVSASVVAETRSLGSLEPGEDAVIRSFVLPALKRLCADIGLREGDAVLCRGATPGLLLLELSSRQVIGLARDWARFVRVGVAGTVAEPPV